MNRFDIIENAFVCPCCKSRVYVSSDGKSMYCKGKKKHCFDFSSDGYLSLGLSGGDSKEAVKARSSFLSLDNYLTAANFIVDTMDELLDKNSFIVDAGCGEGYYTEKIAERFSCAVGFDLSKFACMAGAKRAKKKDIDNLLYATGSVFELPICDKYADAVVNIFAPCAEDEYSRILKDGGYLFVVGAGKDHLMGLKEAIYDNTYENAERADLPKNMEHVKKVNIKYDTCVEGNENIKALFSMTPYYWRTSESDKAKLTGLETLITPVDFEINIYRK